MLIAAVKWLLFAVVLFYVGRKSVELTDAESLSKLSIHPLWLFAAGVVYLVGWLPSVVVWQRLMRVLGARPPFAMTLKAYYLGHLGKYVPGKAAAIFLRSSTLQAVGVPIGTSVLTAMLETLMVMGVGLALAIGLAPFLLPSDVWNALPPSFNVLRTQSWLGPTIVLVATMLGVPLAAESLLRFAARKAHQRERLLETSSSTISSRSVSSDSGPVEDLGHVENGPHEIPNDRREMVRLMFVGVFALVPTWFAQGLSLGCVLKSIGAIEQFSFADWLLWTGATGAGNSLGFFVLFAPGGLGVREGILIASLSPAIGHSNAVAAAALLRLLWLVAELVAVGLLLAIRRKNEPS